MTVRCQNSNFSSETTELELTTPLEAALARLNGVLNISSSSSEGNSQIKIQLDKWTDPETFRFEVSSIIRQIYPLLPRETSFPTIDLNQGADVKEQAILVYAVTGSGSKEKVTEYIDNEVRPRFQHLEGLDRIETSGERPTYIVIEPDPEKLKQLKLNVSDLRNKIAPAFESSEIGLVHTGRESIHVFQKKIVNSPAQLADLNIVLSSGDRIRLSNISTISKTKLSKNSISRVNGKEPHIVMFFGKDNANNIKLAAQIKEIIAEMPFEETSGTNFHIQYDQSKYIKEELNKIYLRTALSILLLLFFLILLTRKVRYIFIVFASVIANVLISCIGYYLLDVDIHLYSLAGITISLGLVTDNVIVITEDIRRTGKNRIFAAILASTFIALGAISVVFFINEDQKLNLIDFSLAIIVNLFVSLPIAYFLIPAILELLPITRTSNRRGVKSKRWLVLFNRAYEKFILFAITRKKYFYLGVILTFGIPVFLLPDKLDDNAKLENRIYNSTIGSTFFNENLREPSNILLGGMMYNYLKSRRVRYNRSEEETQLIVDITLPTGASMNHIDEICRRIEQILALNQPILEVFTTNIRDPSHARIQVFFKENLRPYIPHRLKNVLEINAHESGAADFSIYGIGDGFNNSVNIERFDAAILLRGYNYSQLQAFAIVVRDSLLKYKRTSNVLISSRKDNKQLANFEYSIKFSKPEQLTLTQKRNEKIDFLLNNVNNQSIMIGDLHDSTMNTLNYVILNNGYNVEPDIWNVNNISLNNKDSTSFKLKEYSEISKIKIGTEIIRENQEYLIYVNYNFLGSFQLNDIMTESILSATTPLLPLGYKIETSGNGDLNAGNLNSLWYIPLILLIIYMISAILLESFSRPLSIVFLIPFSFIGVFLFFKMLNVQFDDGGFAALLMLSGLVTNAGIYILDDYSLNKKKFDLTLNHSVSTFIRAFNFKSGPILITTLSAVLSLLPFMMFGDEQGFWYALSVGTIGGLLFSLIGSFMLLPITIISEPVPKNNSL